MAGKHNRGMTLVEVLVALAILGLLSLLGYRALDSTLRVRDRVAVEAGRWRELSFFFDRLRDDLDQPAMRGGRAANGDPRPLWKGNDTSLDIAALGHDASPVRRMQYRWNAGTVELLLWPVFDAAPETLPEVHKVVGDARSLRFRYLGRTRAWVDVWPPRVTDTEAPLAVRVDLVLTDGTHVGRIFALP
jgi:general secretion pathway protein J